MWKHRRYLKTPDVTWGIIMGQAQQMWAELLRVCSTPLHRISALRRYVNKSIEITGAHAKSFYTGPHNFW
jgi:hypothetical protein